MCSIFRIHEFMSEWSHFDFTLTGIPKTDKVSVVWDSSSRKLLFIKSQLRLEREKFIITWIVLR